LHDSTDQRVRIQRLAEASMALGCLVLGGGLILRQAWTPQPQRALPTIVGMLVMAAGVWIVWKWRQHDGRRPIAPVDRIVSASAAILIAVALTAGTSGFVMLETQTQAANTHLLEQTARTRAAIFDDTIRNARDEAAALSQLPGLADARRKSHGEPTKSAIVLRDATTGSFRAATVVSPSGETIARQGKPVASSPIAVPVGDGDDATLLWDGGLVVCTRNEIVSPDDEVAGYLVADRALPALTARLNDDSGIGRTGDALLCARIAAGQARCLPHASNRGFENVAIDPASKASALALAFGLKRGTLIATDARGVETIAAYAPLLSGRLALVVQQDTSEIFAPIRARLLLMVGILAALIGCGLMLLRARVRPLAARIVSSELAAREALDEVAAIVGSVADGLVTADLSSRILTANPAAERMFGYPAGGLVGRDFNDLLPKEFHAPKAGGLDIYVRGEGRRGEVGQSAGQSIELVGRRNDGSEFPIELSMETIERADGRRYVAVIRDATARQKAGKALLLEKERLRVTLHSIGDAVISTDTHGLINFMNPVAEQLTGWKNGEAIGQPIESVYAVVRAEFGDKAANPVDFVLSTGAVGGMDDDTVLVRRDGTRVDIEDSASAIRDGDGRIVGVVLVFRDATQSRRLSGHIHHQATHDALTDLANRREFEKQLTATLKGEGPQTHGHVLMFIDLDQFKIVNDTAGHAAGDKLLKQVAGLLRSRLRGSDLLARMGGDEFAVLLRDCPMEPGNRIAESLRHVVAEIRFDWEGTIFRIGASIGVVHFEAGAAITQLLSEADSACYLAKEQGRNRVYVHHAENEDVMRRSGELNWTSRIHAALADNRFVLYAQKIVPIAGSRSKELHYELLVRMKDEQGELVPPMAFIPAAERYGLMPAIDRWVVSHAFESLAMARSRGAWDTMFSINLSGATLGDNGFADFVEDQFRLHDVPPDRICFEVTETAAITNLIQAGRLIERLKIQGCKFSLDDFGAGMSSFTYLKNLSIDFLKIDGSFVRNIMKDEVDASMADAINRVGHVMGIKTVAEFVEDDAILQRLRFIGVDYAQGYAIEVPCPLASIIPPARPTNGIGPARRFEPQGAPMSAKSVAASRWNAR